MFVYLDESGDLGFNFSTSNPSKFFTITILVCHSASAFFGLKTAISRTLTHKFNKKKTKRNTPELKGTNTTLAIKKYFYSEVLKHPDQSWEIYSISLDKQKFLRKFNITINAHRLYNTLSREIINGVDFSNLTANVKLIVDKSKGGYQRRIFDKYLKDNIEPKLPMNTSMYIVHERSDLSAGLQAVDLFCYGIVRKRFSSDSSWYSEYASKIKTEISWIPKNYQQKK